MSDYIERSVIERLLTIAAAGDGEKKRRTWAKAICVLHDAPAADVASVRHKRWDNSGRFTFQNGRLAVRCSGCGACLRKKEYERYVWDFCPVCGAKMDGGDDGAMTIEIDRKEGGNAAGGQTND